MKNKFLVVGILIAILPMASCHHKNDITPKPPTPPDTTIITPPKTVLDTTYNPVDPSVAASVGFFLDDWEPKQFVVPANTNMGLTSTAKPTDTINIDMNKVIVKVPTYLFGNNVNSWMGQMVDGKNSNPSLMQYLMDLNPHILRFPGGSISDTYFWNAPVNSPPADVATTIYNGGQAQTVGASYYWYGTHPSSDSWTISVDNYYNVLQQTNSTGIIIVNYGYARYGTGATPVQTAAHLAADWVRYDKGRSKYWEVGNEVAGDWEACYQIDTKMNKDGQPQIITGALYGQHFKVFADSMRKAAQEIGVSIKIGAVVIGNPSGPSGMTSATWNAAVFSTMGDYADFFIVHNYYAPYHQNLTASVIFNSALTETKQISTYLTSNTSSNSIQMKPVAMTEWNIEAEGSKQKVSAVAGMHAVLCVGEMLNNGFGQASRWDLANAWINIVNNVSDGGGNDHGLFNMPSGIGSSDPSESAWNPRPAFYYLYYMQKYLGDRLVTTSVSPSSSDLTVYSSSFSSGEAGMIIVNRGTKAHTTLVNINHFNPGIKYYWYNLAPGTDNGEFSAEVTVNGNGPTQGNVGGPINAYQSITPYYAPITSGTFKVYVPARSTLFVVAENKK